MGNSDVDMIETNLEFVCKCGSQNSERTKYVRARLLRFLGADGKTAVSDSKLYDA